MNEFMKTGIMSPAQLQQQIEKNQIEKEKNHMNGGNNSNSAPFVETGLDKKQIFEIVEKGGPYLFIFEETGQTHILVNTMSKPAIIGILSIFIDKFIKSA